MSKRPGGVISARFKDLGELRYVEQMISLTTLTPKQFARIALINEAKRVHERAKQLIEQERTSSEEQKKSERTSSQEHTREGNGSTQSPGHSQEALLSEDAPASTLAHEENSADTSTPGTGPIP